MCGVARESRRDVTSNDTLEIRVRERLHHDLPRPFQIHHVAQLLAEHVVDDERDALVAQGALVGRQCADDVISGRFGMCSRREESLGEHG